LTRRLARRVIAALLAICGGLSGQTFRVYIGGFTKPNMGKGISVSRLDGRTGILEPAKLAAVLPEATFQTLHPSGRFLYSTSELPEYEGQPSGGVYAYAAGAASGELTFLNRVASGGAGPCHISITGDGRFVAVANYAGGSVAVFAVEADGRLGKRTALVRHKGEHGPHERQDAPHAHSVDFSADARFLIVSDLGLDRVFSYPFDAKAGRIDESHAHLVAIAPGSGPRHFAFHPNGRFGYVISELASTLTALAYDARTGKLRPLHTSSTLPADPGIPKDANRTAEVAVSADGRFVYGSNRGHESIAQFEIRANGEAARLVDNARTDGRGPRNFALVPGGRWVLVANRSTHQVVVFARDPATGRLTIGSRIDVPDPSCLRILPLEKKP